MWGYLSFRKTCFALSNAMVIHEIQQLGLGVNVAGKNKTSHFIRILSQGSAYGFCTTCTVVRQQC